jgi:glucose/arabinose dehydrogenase
VTAAPGDGSHVYVVEQPGVIVRVRMSNGARNRFLDIRGRVGSSGSEQGLLSMAFHPRYAQNRRFFVNYTNTSGDTRVVAFRANASGTRGLRSTAHTWFGVNQPYENHNGGQLQFGNNGLLYIGMGDGGSGGDPENRAQNMGSRLGKLLRLNVNKSGARPRISALGLRNPWRFSVDRRTGVFWIADVGQESWEEVDRFVPGNSFRENFGWSRFEGRHRVSNRRLTAGRNRFPVHEYSHSGGRCSITGGYRVRGSVPGAGRYFFGDYCTGEVWSFRWVNGRKTGFRREAFTVPGLLSSFGLGPGGSLLAISYSGGTVYRVTRR